MKFEKQSKRDQKWTTIEKKLLNIFGNILKAIPGTFRDFVQKQKQIQSFREFMIILVQSISFPKSFLKALTIFLAIYQGQS